MFYVAQANPRAVNFKNVGLLDYEVKKNVGGLAYTSANQPCDIDDEEDIEDGY